MASIRIWWYKWRLKSAVLHLWAVEDSYSCSLDLADYLSPRLSMARERVNKYMSILSRIDPAFPKSQLSRDEGVKALGEAVFGKQGD